MKIPFTNCEVKWHTPGTPTDHSASRRQARKTLPGSVTNAFFDGLPVKVRTISDAATSERLRGKFTYLAEKAIKLSAANAPPPFAYRMQAAVGDGTWARKNEKYAHEALHSVRLALYSKEYGSFKSSNKFSPARRELEVERLRKGKFAHWHNPSAINSRHNVALRSKNIWQSTQINCDGLAAAVTDYIAYRHPLAPVSTGALPGHAFAIIGAIDPENVNLPLSAWPSHIYICDPWANIACPAPEYPDKFEQKMKKWHESGKFIGTDGKWISSLDPKWLSCVNETPKIYTRRQFADEQFDTVLLVAPPANLTAAPMASGN
ncbi:hypothetical protein KQH60_11575 [Mycetohabitans sp. B8]|uniref:hypothetical protein n=1 Tax=Mycetohabitans sp. B8 TaxID=2841845 RepID=UPI001F37D92D|nr:hypothetical protein [Mycetohabitans sp. B8]MCG1043138.1 hypothetical protein [Mycetohabitans sp. B8]